MKEGDKGSMESWGDGAADKMTTHWALIWLTGACVF